MFLTANVFSPITAPTTNDASLAMAELAEVAKVRFSTWLRATYFNAAKLVRDGMSGQMINVADIFAACQSNWQFNGFAEVGTFMLNYLHFFGFKAERREIEKLVIAAGYSWNQIAPVSEIFDALNLPYTKTGKKGQKVMVDVDQTRTRIWAWINGYNGATKEPNSVCVTVVAHSPNLITPAELAEAQASYALECVIGDELIVTNTYNYMPASVTNKIDAATIHDVQTEGHEVPFTAALTKLVKNGKIALTELGIEDARAFINTAITMGSVTLRRRWLEAIRQTNINNTKIEAGTRAITTVEDADPAAEQKVAAISTMVYDDVTDDTTAELVCVTGRNWAR